MRRLRAGGEYKGLELRFRAFFVFRIYSDFFSFVRSLSEPQFEPEGINPVEIVVDEPLITNKAQRLIQPQSTPIRKRSFQADFIATGRVHCFNCPPSQLSANSLFAHLGRNGQHGNVTATDQTAIVIKFAYDHAANGL